jgi:hypothetical protein
MSQVINTTLSKPITSADGFHHLVYSISGTTHTLFLDNSAIAVNISGGNVFSTYPDIKNLFCGIAGDLSYGYTGYIDDFKVYNRALGSTDVSAIYNSISTVTVSAYTPSSIAGLTIWLDAATSTSFSTTNGVTWQDKSGLGNHMTTTNTTTGYSLITSTLNNKPTIYFPKSYICLRNTNVLNESFPITYFFVYAMVTTTAPFDGNSAAIMSSNYFPDDVNYTGGTHGEIQSTALDVTSFYIGGTAGIPLSNTFTTPNTSSSFCMITIQINGTNNVSSQLVVNVNGTNQVTNSSYVGTFNTSCKGVIIRPARQSIYISEILYYKSLLSTYDIQKVEGYLAWKWGINTLLPTVHPYYSLAPTSVYVAPLDKLSSAAKTAMLYSGTGTTLTAGAYGIILLNTKYTGPAIQIKNGSSGTPTDFYPALDGSTTLKTASGTTLTSFLAGEIAYVTKWYDQTGNGKHGIAQGSPLPFLNTTTFVVDFGTSGFFSLSDGSFPYGNASYSYIFKQGRIPTTASTVWSGGDWGVFGGSGILLCTPTYNDTWYAYDFYGITSVANSVVAATYGGAGNNTGAGGKKFYINNVLQTPTGIDGRTNPNGPRAQIAQNCFLGASHPSGRASYFTYQSTTPYFYWLPYQLGTSDIGILGST